MQALEQETMPDTIEATLNYVADTGEQVFTQTAEPGAQDVRFGGKQDPRRVSIHNGRSHADRFTLEKDGFRFVRHDTKVRNFYDADECGGSTTRRWKRW